MTEGSFINPEERTQEEKKNKSEQIKHLVDTLITDIEGKENLVDSIPDIDSLIDILQTAYKEDLISTYTLMSKLYTLMGLRNKAVHEQSEIKSLEEIADNPVISLSISIIFINLFKRNPDKDEAKLNNFYNPFIFVQSRLENEQKRDIPEKTKSYINTFQKMLDLITSVEEEFVNDDDFNKYKNGVNLYKKALEYGIDQLESLLSIQEQESENQDFSMPESPYFTTFAKILSTKYYSRPYDSEQDNPQLRHIDRHINDRLKSELDRLDPEKLDKYISIYNEWLEAIDNPETQDHKDWNIFEKKIAYLSSSLKLIRNTQLNQKEYPSTDFTIDKEDRVNKTDIESDEDDSTQEVVLSEVQNRLQNDIGLKVEEIKSLNQEYSLISPQEINKYSTLLSKNNFHHSDRESATEWMSKSLTQLRQEEKAGELDKALNKYSNLTEVFINSDDTKKTYRKISRIMHPDRYDSIKETPKGAVLYKRAQDFSVKLNDIYTNLP